MAKTRANGEGTIRQRKDGAWEARYTVGRDPLTGKQIQKSVYAKSQKDLTTKLRKIQTDIEGGTFISPSKLKLSDWLEQWLNNYVKITLSSSTYDSYNMLTNAHIIPKLGQIKLADLKSYMLQKFYKDLLDGGRVLTKGKISDDLSLSTATVHKVHNIIHKALNQAVKDQLIKINPDDSCELPKIQKKELNVLPEDDVQKFIDEVSKGYYYPLFVLELSSGLRRGEILGLTWDCIHFDDNTIDVKQQLKRENGKTDITNILKTSTSRRKLSVPEFVMDILKEHQTMQQAIIGKQNEKNLVFCNDFGKPFYPTTINHYFKVIQKRIILPNLSFHDLRHSYATWALSHGIDYKTLQENLGHSNASFTIQTYPQSTMDMKKKSADTIGNFLSVRVNKG